MREVLEPLRRWSEDGARAGLATLVRVRRSAPRPPGARFAVSDRGDVAGSVSAGCVEGDVHEHIREVLAGGGSRVLHYGITDEMAMGVGLSCGGEIDVRVAPHDPEDSVWPELERVLDAGEAALLLSGLSEGTFGRQLLVRPDGSRVGSLGSRRLDDRAAGAADHLLDTRGTAVLELEDESATLFAENYLPPPRLAIVGGGPVAEALCELAAHLEFSVVVIEPREAFAAAGKFPAAERVIGAWPRAGLRQAGLDRYLDVVVLAHDRKLDVPALETALRAGCLYVGQLGGRRTQEARRRALEERGLPRERIERIHGPVGLEIGAESPAEIALSILAELVAARRGAVP